MEPQQPCLNCEVQGFMFSIKSTWYLKSSVSLILSLISWNTDDNRTSATLAAYSWQTGSHFLMPYINWTLVCPMDGVQYRSDFWLRWRHNAVFSSANDPTMMWQSSTLGVVLEACASPSRPDKTRWFTRKHVKLYVADTDALTSSFCERPYEFLSVQRPFAVLGWVRRWEKQIDASERNILDRYQKEQQTRQASLFVRVTADMSFCLPCLWFCTFVI